MSLLPEAAGQAPGTLFDLNGHPTLRHSVFPLAFHRIDESFVGLGSSFCVSFEGYCVTAMHVVSDTIAQAQCSPADSGAIGIVYVPGLIYGQAVLKPFRLVPQFQLYPGDPDPLVFGQDKPDLRRIKLDLPAFSPQFLEGEQPTPLWVRTARLRRTRIGDQLIAVGYDQIVGSRSPDREAIDYEHSLKGCVVTVHEFDLRRESATRGGPIIILKENLPPGFSGGPVFAKDGAIVGVVSTGNTMASYSTLVGTEELPEENTIFVGQNHENQNWFTAWGVFVASESEPRQVFWRKTDAAKFAGTLPGATVRKGTRPRFDERAFIYSLGSA